MKIRVEKSSNLKRAAGGAPTGGSGLLARMNKGPLLQRLGEEKTKSADRDVEMKDGPSYVVHLRGFCATNLTNKPFFSISGQDPALSATLIPQDVVDQIDRRIAPLEANRRPLKTLIRNWMRMPRRTPPLVETSIWDSF